MKSTQPMPGYQPVRRDQLRPERVHDTYKLRGKLAEPTVCTKCGAVFHNGRWQWSDRPPGAHEVVCPACQRIADRYPAGFVHLGGTYFAAHRDEIVKLLRHREEREKGEHPLARIVAIEEVPEGVVVTTTDIHLARDLGEAVHHAHQGELDFHYNEGENLLRVNWQR